MEIIAIVVSVLTIVIGIYVNHSKTNKRVLSDTTEVNEQLASSRPTQAPTSSPEASLEPTIAPTQSPIPLPSSLVPFGVITGQISEFIYPSANVILQRSAKLSLQSSDDPTKITNWYKDKLKNSGFNSNSAALANTNGNILNKFAAANSEIKVKIQISKKTGETVTSIEVELQ